MATPGSFKPGQSGNPKGRPKKGYSITAMMRELVSTKVTDKNTGEKVEVRRAIGKSILKKAIEGDIAAQKLIWQYMDGMPIQVTDLTSGGKPIGTLSKGTMKKIDKMYEKNTG